MAAEPEPTGHEPRQGLPTNALPGKGVLGWLGRQVGYVKQAVQHPVPDSVQDTSAEAKVYRQTRVEEQAVSDRPKVTLRRTTIDEVVVIEEPVKQSGDTENTSDGR